MKGGVEKEEECGKLETKIVCGNTVYAVVSFSSKLTRNTLWTP